MCNISAICLKVGDGRVGKDFLRDFDSVQIKGDLRGRDSFGLTIQNSLGETESVFFEGSYFDNRKEILSFLGDHLFDIKAILVNHRACPLPEAKPEVSLPENKVIGVQPVVGDRFVLVHNGTISNDRELMDQYKISRDELKFRVDSEVLLKILELNCKGKTVGEVYLCFQSCIRELKGGVSVLVLDCENPGVIFGYKNFKPLSFHCRQYSGYQAVFFDSEHSSLLSSFSENSNGFFDQLPNGVLPTYSSFYYDSNEEKYSTHSLQTTQESYLPKLDKRKALIICSGGLDSVTAAYQARKEGKDVTLLYMDYGCLATESEIRSIKSISEFSDFDYRVERMDFYKNLSKVSPLLDTSLDMPEGDSAVETVLCWVPARNLVLISLAFAIAESEGYSCIYTGWNLEESGSFPDNDIDFLRLCNKISDYATLSRPKLIMVLEKLMKPEILELGFSLDVPYDLTWSCYLSDPEQKPCGICGSCMNRRLAFQSLGVSDSQIYKNSFAGFDKL